LTKLTLELSYQIALDEVRQRLEKERLRLTNYLGEQGGSGAATWDGDTLNFSARLLGSNIEGTLTLADGIASLNANVPFPMLIFRGKLEKRLRKLLKIDVVD
jgi:Putative polyhydroxyalkanoic acid system protein (PHA_gran_rgn)